MTGDAQNLTVGESVASARCYCGLVVCFPTAGVIVIAACIPVQCLIAAIIPMTTCGTAALTSAASALPCSSNHTTRKSHTIGASFLRWKLTKRRSNVIMNLRDIAPGKPPVLPQTAVSASWRRFLSAQRLYHKKLANASFAYVEKYEYYQHIIPERLLFISPWSSLINLPKYVCRCKESALKRYWSLSSRCDIIPSQVQIPD